MPPSLQTLRATSGLKSLSNSGSESSGVDDKNEEAPCATLTRPAGACLSLTSLRLLQHDPRTRPTWRIYAQNAWAALTSGDSLRSAEAVSSRLAWSRLGYRYREGSAHRDRARCAGSAHRQVEGGLTLEHIAVSTDRQESFVERQVACGHPEGVERVCRFARLQRSAPLIESGLKPACFGGATAVPSPTL